MVREEASWSDPRVLIVLALIFICGVAAGTAGTRTYYHVKAHKVALSVQQLKEKLKLTPEQERIVIRELDDYGKYYQNIEEQREDVARMGKQRIFEVLTPEQRKRFDEVFPQLPH
jgi:hypothetical protein